MKILYRWVLYKEKIVELNGRFSGKPCCHLFLKNHCANLQHTRYTLFSKVEIEFKHVCFVMTISSSCIVLVVPMWILKFKDATEWPCDFLFDYLSRIAPMGCLRLKTPFQVLSHWSECFIVSQNNELYVVSRESSSNFLHSSPVSVGQVTLHLVSRRRNSLRLWVARICWGDPATWPICTVAQDITYSSWNVN